MTMDSGEHQDFFFIQLSDPQFGLFAALSGVEDAYIEEKLKQRLRVRKAPKIRGFADETRLYRKAIDAANRLRPDFVVVCGDMTQDSDDIFQLNELMTITAELDEEIPMRWVAGNHDVGNDLTPESLALYRGRFGKDNYAFDHKGSRFIALNSNVGYDPSKVSGEWERQVEFLEQTLDGPREQRAVHTVAFTHHPLFLDHRDEPDSTLVIPTARRLVLLDLLNEHGAWGMFSGHWHLNNYASDGEFQMVTSAAVGYPLGDDPSGLRIVKVYADRIEHEYYGFDEVPDQVEM